MIYTLDRTHTSVVENLPSIRSLGSLCSKQVLEEHGLWPSGIDSGGDDLSHSLDKSHDNWDKVALNFTPHTPMVFNRKKNIGNQICFFIIKPRVATWQGVVFTNTNAAKVPHLRERGMAGLNLVDFEAVKAHPFKVYDWVKLVQAEVLVPDCIALDQIEKVVFVSKASCREAERLWGPFPHPPFEIARDYFAKNFREASSILFSYLDDFCLVDSGSNQRFTGHPIRLCREPARDICAEARIRAESNTRVRMTLAPEGIELRVVLPRHGMYLYHPPLSTDLLPAGAYSVECHLNDIRWARLDFELTD